MLLCKEKKIVPSKFPLPLYLLWKVPQGNKDRFLTHQEEILNNSAICCVYYDTWRVILYVRVRGGRAHIPNKELFHKVSPEKIASVK